MKSITLSEKDIVRFWSKVKIGNPNECWEWQGTESHDGYGQFGIGTSKKHWTIRPNRILWTIINGSIPEGHFVCHKCDNRSCVNPNHLFLGTPKDNMVDMAKKGRTGISLGEKHGTSKLKQDDIPVIKKLLLRKIPQIKIAEIYNVSQYAISKIKTGKTWRDQV